MGPKKAGTRSSKTKKVAEKKKEEQKKEVTLKSGVDPKTFFGRKKSTPAAAVTGVQAGASTSASVGPSHQPRPKQMSGEEVASLMVESSDTEPELNLSLSQSSTHSTQEGTQQKSGEQQPAPAIVDVQPEPPPAIVVVQQPPPAIVDAQRKEQTQPPPAIVVVPQPPPAIVDVQRKQQPQPPPAIVVVQEPPPAIVVVVPPEVGAVQEIEPDAEQEEAATHAGDLLFSKSPPRKRRVSPWSSLPSIPSDDLDLNWEPQQSEHERERHPKKTRLGKRKVPGSLPLMECDVEQPDNYGDDESDPVITSITPGPEDMETNILTLSRLAATRDVARIPPTQATPKLPPASSFTFAQSRQRPTSTTSSTSSEVGSGTTAQPHSEFQHTTSSSSGFGSGTSSRRQKLSSPVWDFFTVSANEENIAICSICHSSVSRGKLGTNYGTGGQMTHMKKYHAIKWEDHLRIIKAGTINVGGEAVEGPRVEQEEEGDILSGSGTLSTSVRLPSTAVVDPTSSASATSQWHQSKSNPETPRSTGAKSATRSTASGITERNTKQRTIVSMFRQEGKYECNHPIARLYNAKPAKMLALDFLPFSFVEGVGFLEFVTTLCPKWNVPSRYYFAREKRP
ncbi:uncharacterized protein LOC144784212 [Lissotriton helveticus]